MVRNIKTAAGKQHKERQRVISLSAFSTFVQVHRDLYLWKYGSFYVSRDWLSIIPNCPKENIVLIDRNKGILQCCNKKLLEKDYPFMVFRQKSSGVYKICEDRFISNTLRMLLNIFVKN